MSLPASAAILYILIITGVIVFQCCLISGAPWGHLTQGGQRQGALPMSGRLVAFFSIPLLLFMGAAVTSAASLPPGWSSWTGWSALAIQSLSTVLNWITRSVPERKLWGPITSIMLVLVAYVVITQR